jgi:hypothetical protein
MRFLGAMCQEIGTKTKHMFHNLQRDIKEDSLSNNEPFS